MLARELSATPAITVPWEEVEAHRVAGELDVQLPRQTSDTLRKEERLRPHVMLQVCIGTVGAVTSFEHLGGKADHDLVQPAEVSPAFRDHYQNELSLWRFEPFQRDGQVVPVCATRVLSYRLPPWLDVGESRQ